MLVVFSMKWLTSVLKRAIHLKMQQICSLQLRMKASLRSQVTEDKFQVPLPRDEAPSKQILRLTNNSEFVLTSYEYSSFTILCSLVKS